MIADTKFELGLDHDGRLVLADALWYARQYSVPWLGDLDHKMIWPDFAAHWGGGLPFYALMPVNGQCAPGSTPVMRSRSTISCG